ncbi:hypothetical protein SXCC_04404 [Gluconacetobacter sp. SXCC-1]|nr:hypothetical protein SXCC_04404 [Gluconacetobacter sp. SXCC-1]
MIREAPPPLMRPARFPPGKPDEKWNVDDRKRALTGIYFQYKGEN